MRAPLFILLATLLGATAARATDVFVVNSNDANISVIDLATHQVIKTIPLLREPHHLVLSPDKRSLVVGDTTGNALFFLDPRTGDVQRRVTVSDPYQLLYSPNAKFLTTAGLARNQIDIYDANTLALLHRVPARSMPSHIAYSPDSSMVFVSLQGTNRLIAIRTRDRARGADHPHRARRAYDVLQPRRKIDLRHQPGGWVDFGDRSHQAGGAAHDPRARRTG